MPNEIYRSRVINNIKLAVARAEEASADNHKGMRGTIREIAIENLLRPVLQQPFGIAEGKIIDSTGAQSAQTDLIIYNPSVLPGIMHTDRMGHLPAESVTYSIEIKSRLDATELRQSIENARTVRRLREARSYYRISSTGPTGWQLEPANIYPMVFAFASDLTVKDELDRLVELDEEAWTQPAIMGLCVVGRGYWWRSVGCWECHAPTDEHDEVINFLSTIVNKLGGMTENHAPLGQYLMRDDLKPTERRKPE
jgi:hypothetical protein